MACGSAPTNARSRTAAASAPTCSRRCAQLPVPLLRWPGGCYADHYHWRDGIGPPRRAPAPAGHVVRPAGRGRQQPGHARVPATCAPTIGAEPYLAGNVGSGTPQELCDWLEYCNTRAPTRRSAASARANGAAKPFGVKLWGVGNENWGCGGNFDAVTYAHEYRRYATMLRHVDPTRRAGRVRP